MISVACTHMYFYSYTPIYISNIVIVYAGLLDMYKVHDQQLLMFGQ